MNYWSFPPRLFDNGTALCVEGQHMVHLKDFQDAAKESRNLPMWGWGIKLRSSNWSQTSNLCCRPNVCTPKSGVILEFSLLGIPYLLGKDKAGRCGAALHNTPPKLHDLLVEYRHCHACRSCSERSLGCLLRTRNCHHGILPVQMSPLSFGLVFSADIISYGRSLWCCCCCRTICRIMYRRNHCNR